MPYISKWWEENLTDDSLLLLDYFGTKNTNNFNLNEIFEDIHLNNIMDDNSFKDGDLYFEVNENYIPHFDMSSSVVVDLSTILLETLKNNEISIKEIDKYSEYDKTFKINSKTDDIKKLKSSLDFFVENGNSFEIADFFEEDDFKNYLNDCREISAELSKYC
ncbi:MAG: imm68 putative immunity domain-containing protein [Aestuariibaculum sp.]